MNNKIYILLDRSGSMDSMWKEAIGGINGYVRGVEGNADVVLATFDSISYDVIRNTTVKNWKPLTQTEVTPRSGTPLLDAAGRIIYDMIDSGAERAILVVVTDGEENSSTKFRASEITDLTNNLTEKYNYEIVFLGANFNRIADVARQNFGWNDQSRVMATSINGFASAMNATATGTSSYLATGLRSGQFYNQADKEKAKK